jgi:hypothetical protein
VSAASSAELEICAQQITANDINGSRGADIRCGNARYLIKGDNLVLSVRKGATK